MPKHESSLNVTRFNDEITIAYCYLAMQQIGWEITYDGEQGE